MTTESLNVTIDGETLTVEIELLQRPLAAAHLYTLT